MTGFQICLASWHCLPKEYSMADWKTTSGFSVNTRIFTLGRSIYLIGIFSFLAEYLCFVFALWHLPFFTDMTWFSFSNRSRRFPPKKRAAHCRRKFWLFVPWSTFCWATAVHLSHAGSPKLPLFECHVWICHIFFVALACMKTVKWWMWLTLIIFFSPSGQRRTQNAQIWLELGIFVRHFVHKLLVLTKN